METSIVPEKSKEAMDESTVLNALWESFGLLWDIAELDGGEVSTPEQPSRRTRERLATSVLGFAPLENNRYFEAFPR